jgi:hypothetical protein
VPVVLKDSPAARKALEAADRAIRIAQEEGAACKGDCAKHSTLIEVAQYAHQS